MIIATKRLNAFFKRFDHSLSYIICGLHSGFRLCDILWFAFAWAPFDLWHTRYYKWYESRKRTGGGVKCPLCAILGPIPVKTKRCDCTYKYSVEFFALSNIKNWINPTKRAEARWKSGLYKRNHYKLVRNRLKK